MINRLPIREYEVYLVKIIKMIILFILAISLVFLTGYLFRGVKLSIIEWIVSSLLLLFGALAFLTLGTILSNFKEEKTASVCANILFLGLALLGGLWFPTEQFPSWLQSISKMTPTYHFRELAVGYINKGSIPIVSILAMLAYSCLFLGISYLIILKTKKSHS
ncbi:ABC-2 type transport system permease [Enterococcus sp. DIV2381]